ncbi:MULTISPECIES: nicotinate-nucleotide adenylyltransferase [unclassified Shewanella]|uniref:nicotinate-nucleotide adenylyltransferase n=1 Tax=unclassified Shewanella TaxID=196818 RepID=UPI001BC59D9A|nr:MULTISPECIES: nicotinate-nucleotide adenylyltransferase [unclassified Shewanella]GIU18334.1 putative nicotinate-nucleotide adenylyltransferase [Shewanella sp. MBTL60-112-B1]GIU37044.1 putative nicotinate-nucleotide adenylyltransferase [Shewanella sp. MBTL60-112-B2]
MKIGILGGTFDPIHFGHIRPAQEVKQQLNLDEVWLMPNHIPPHKLSTHVSTQDRLAMAQLVCDQLSGFKLCDIEVKRETPSYTAQTLSQLTAQHPEHQFYFIMGMDSFLSLNKWYQWQQLFNLCHIVVCKRPGWELTDNDPIHTLLKLHLSKQSASSSHQACVGEIFMVDVTEQDISSTEIRQLLQQGKIPASLPQTIQAYIQNNQLYLPDSHSNSQ